RLRRVDDVGEQDHLHGFGRADEAREKVRPPAVGHEAHAREDLPEPSWAPTSGPGPEAARGRSGAAAGGRPCPESGLVPRARAVEAHTATPGISGGGRPLAAW